MASRWTEHSIVNGTLLRCAVLGAGLLLSVVGQSADHARTAVISDQFTLMQLSDPQLITLPASTSAYSMPIDALPPLKTMSGTLTYRGASPSSHVSHRDVFEITKNPNLRAGSLPAFELTLISDQQQLLVRERGPQPGQHPYWEFMPEPGRVWQDTENPGWNRAVLPFSVKEINQNCLHNGLMTFAWHDDGRISQMAWQVGSETCAYLQLDSWGLAEIELEPHPVADAQAIRQASRLERERRLPVRPIEKLTQRYPGIDLKVLAPPFPEHTTVYGAVINGVHYRGGCNTRFGAHPYCDVLAIPSYSTAKSLFVGLAYSRMVKQWPDIESTMLTALVPECELEDQRWRGVTLRHLADMTSGNFVSTRHSADENDAAMAPFFLADSNAEKVAISCALWPKHAEPGETMVYHTTDHYLLGVALGRFLRAKSGPDADLYRDVVYTQVLLPAAPGPLLAFTQRTNDADAQPFAAYGLFYHPDDVARLGLYLQDDEKISPLFRERDRADMLFRDQSRSHSVDLPFGERYSLGFWGMDMAARLGCEQPVWIPFMVGYGGIIWALLPNGGVYYFFSDNGHGSWSDAIIELNKNTTLCE